MRGSPQDRDDRLCGVVKRYGTTTASSSRLRPTRRERGVTNGAPTDRLRGVEERKEVPPRASGRGPEPSSSRGRDAPPGRLGKPTAGRRTAEGHTRKASVGTEVPGDRRWSGTEKVWALGEPWCHESGAPGSGRGRWKRAVERQYLAGGLLHLRPCGLEALASDEASLERGD
jgi:hypothetical protein